MVMIASTSQKEAYTGRFPLYGTVVIDSKRCNVEDMRGFETGHDNPNFQVVAPEGYCFYDTYTRATAVWSINEIGRLARNAKLESIYDDREQED